ncbi:xanthine dehydrogenase family protein molybdopterin-binding subunit [Phreatobacter stygius]|uniref:Xanthine dehydrogenase family protein molybdopterin-binding subunit n=1 Tax=Phreatobacter stygius TaxID=1940610 RepID=A0A4D7B4M3_9HYPH|nr:xanthine dehydrogenase family protein molybdopterin-binding subunit [Phreatobacter stygius]QCI63142.1 xanthine dehydrogenase family protein molybdopterin-binding subunit [Phreatobacter stygius]
MSNATLAPALDRRALLKTGAGLVVAVVLPTGLGPALAQPQRNFTPDAFIRIDNQGGITLVMPMIEMGQGTYTSLAMLIAEELEVDLDEVTVAHAPPDDKLYANALLGAQMTGGSTSIRGFWTPLRQAGATARGLLIAAAAKEWGVDPATCKASHGVVSDGGSRRLGYGELAAAAAALPVPAPASVTLKQPKDFTLIGTPAKRVDAPDKVTGRAAFGIDVKLPGMGIAAIAVSPVFGGKPKTVNQAAARAVKGVRQVVIIDEAVAVVADHMGAAKKGLAAAAIQWDDGPNARLSSADIIRQLDEASKQPGAVARNEGDAAKALAGAAQRIEAIYQLPFLAHATMEPMNCTVHVRPDACDIWVGTQVPTFTVAAAAAVTGLPPARITVHNHLLGGGFGRRLDVDGTILAVKIALAVRGPVKVVWSREEDIQHDMYRPYYYDRLAAGLDAQGKPVAWTHRVSGSSIMARYVPAAFVNGLDPDAVEGAAEPPYAFPNIHVDYVRVEPPGIPTSWWRGVGPTHNVFVVESFIDELAAAAKQDPVAYRRALLGHNPRALAVLNLAAEKAGWGSALPARRGRGISLQFAFGSYLALVAEVEVAPDGQVRVHRIVAAVDCGIVVNPDTLEAQVQGGALFGLTAALYGAITLKDGRVEQGNFDSYRPMRIDEVPVIETHVVKNTEAPGGLGEVATSAVSPAVTNAIFAATAKRIRTLPIDPGLLKSGA